MGVHYNIFYFGVLEGFSIMKYLSDFFPWEGSQVYFSRKIRLISFCLSACSLNYKSWIRNCCKFSLGLIDDGEEEEEEEKENPSRGFYFIEHQLCAGPGAVCFIPFFHPRDSDA